MSYFLPSRVPALPLEVCPAHMNKCLKLGRTQGALNVHNWGTAAKKLPDRHADLRTYRIPIKLLI